MCTCLLHTLKNISHELIGYDTKLALTGLDGLIKYLNSTLHKL